MEQLTPTTALCALARAGLEPTLAVDGLAGLGPTGWAELTELARHHDLAPLCYAALAHCPVPVPDAARGALRQRAFWSEAQADRAADQLEEVVTAFNAVGITPILLKGAFLSRRYYPTPGLRPFSDLDILVRATEVDRAMTCLEALGYAAPPTVMGRDHRYYLEQHHHHLLSRPGSLKVELHWDLTPPRSPVRFDLEGLRQRAQAARVGPAEARGLSAEDEVVAAAAHAAKHQLCTPLRQYVDLAAIQASEAGIDWDEVLRRARAAGADGDLGVYLAVARQLGFLTLAEEFGERVTALLPSRFPLAEVVRYVVGWPLFDHPFGAIDVLTAPSAPAAAGALLRALRGSGESHALPGPSLAGEPSRSGGWPARLRRTWARRARVRDDMAQLRAAVSVRRRFSDREAP